MSIRCGFFNSVNNDRKYDAVDMGRLFEGVISDGVFSNFGDKFEVVPVDTTMNLTVKTGKAWFYERYFEIYDPVTVSIRISDTQSRIDAVCICINTTDSVRGGSIEVLEGQEEEEPTKPQIPTEDGVYYIPIAWVTVGPNDTVSTDLDIVSNVGNSTDEVEEYRCPYSEVTIDPRKGMYIYEGTSVIDPLLNSQSGIIEIPGDEFMSPTQAENYVYNIKPSHPDPGRINYVEANLQYPMNSDTYMIIMQPWRISRKSNSTGDIDYIEFNTPSMDYIDRKIEAFPKNNSTININYARVMTSTNIRDTSAFTYKIQYKYICFEIDIQEAQNE